MKIQNLLLALLSVSTPLSAQTYNVIHNFTNSPDGSWPKAGLVLSGGTLYGVTDSGGTNGDGMVFKVGTNGTGYAIQKSFTGLPDGQGPDASLIVAGDTLYGTTKLGGSIGYGTVFKINTNNGTGYSILKNFSSYDTNIGAWPSGKLVLDSGVLYGTVSTGGNSNRGAVFKINTDGNGFTLLKSFYQNDGWNPQAGVALDGGTLYGTTYQGGTNGYGVVFKVNTNGTGFAVLKTFSDSDGSSPRGGVVVTGGVVYGTTYSGGSSGAGTVFKVNTDGTGFSILKHFNHSDGWHPQGGLILNGNTLYGTTYDGGSSYNGNIFKIKLDGTGFSSVYSFTGSSGGANPLGDLVLDSSTLYGTTGYGGSASRGVVFSLTLPPPPWICCDSKFGVLTNCFGFNVAGTSNQVVVVDACSNLTAANWLPRQTNTLGTNLLYFKDSSWTNYSMQFYRVREP